MEEDYFTVGNNSACLTLADRAHILDDIYVKSWLILVYSLILLVCILGMLVVILVERFHWRTPVFVKLCGGKEVFAGLTVSIFFVMQNLTLDLLVKYKDEQGRVRFWMDSPIRKFEDLPENYERRWNNGRDF